MIKALNYAKKLQQLADDPIGFAIDLIVIVVVSLFIPIPLAGEIAAQYKWQILGAAATFIILLIFMIMAAATILATPTLSSIHLIQSILQTLSPVTSGIAPDPKFIDTQVPKQNPFGGNGMDYTTVTAYFHDPNYYLEFGKEHEGIDLVPSDSYYQNSTTYQQYHQVVIFSTLTGTVNHYIDQYGGETVEVTNNDGSLKTINIHFSSVLVNTGDYIKAGTAIGIMGASGDATAPHLHYQIDTKDGNTWDPVNPLNYIQ